MSDITKAVIATGWYVVINDLVGGYSVSTINYPLSSSFYSKRNPLYKDGGGEVIPIMVADCFDQEVAAHIVALHNKDLSARQG